jgi:hypothetical protein
MSGALESLLHLLFVINGVKYLVQDKAEFTGKDRRESFKIFFG